jgi:hypothetical protein
MEKLLWQISNNGQLSYHVLNELIQKNNVDIQQIVTILDNYNQTKNKLDSCSRINNKFTNYIVEGKLIKIMRILNKYKNVKLSQSDLFTVCNGNNTCFDSLNGYIDNICTSDNYPGDVVYLIKYLNDETIFECDCFGNVHDYDDYFSSCIYMNRLKMAKILFLNFNVNSYNVLERYSCYGDKNYDHFVDTFNIIKTCQHLIPKERQGIPRFEDGVFMNNCKSPKIMEFYKSNFNL